MRKAIPRLVDVTGNDFCR